MSRLNKYYIKALANTSYIHTLHILPVPTCGRSLDTQNRDPTNAFQYSNGIVEALSAVTLHMHVHRLCCSEARRLLAPTPKQDSQVICHTQHPKPVP